MKGQRSDRLEAFWVVLLWGAFLLLTPIGGLCLALTLLQEWGKKYPVRARAVRTHALLMAGFTAALLLAIPAAQKAFDYTSVLYPPVSPVRARTRAGFNPRFHFHGFGPGWGAPALVPALWPVHTHLFPGPAVMGPPMAGSRLFGCGNFPSHGQGPCGPGFTGRPDPSFMLIAKLSNPGGMGRFGFDPGKFDWADWCDRYIVLCLRGAGWWESMRQTHGGFPADSAPLFPPNGLGAPPFRSPSHFQGAEALREPRQ